MFWTTKGLKKFSTEIGYLALISEMPDPILLAQIYDQIAALGSICATRPVPNSL